VVVKIPMKTITVTVRDNSVRGLTKEEEAHETWDETAEELKVLARLLAAHLNKPGKNIEMHDLFWQELKKNLGPEWGRNSIDRLLEARRISTKVRNWPSGDTKVGGDGSMKKQR
jgi:hypothetical protein